MHQIPAVTCFHFFFLLFSFFTLCTVCDVSSWLVDPCICFILETYACPCFTDVNPDVFFALGWKELLANAVE